MNRSNFYSKALITLVTIFLILVATKAYFSPSETMVRSPQQAMTELKSGTHLAVLQELKDTPVESLFLIDLRSMHQFELGHLEGATHMPMRSLEQVSERDRINQVLKSGKKVFIYAENMHVAEGAWLLLYQMGLDGIQVLQIDVHSTSGHLEVKERAESLKMDYAAIYRELSTKPVIKEKKRTETRKKTVQPVKKKKKKAPEGGC